MFEVHFGRKLAQLREQKGLSQEELSLGIMSRENLSLIETGKRNPTTQNVFALFERLGYTPDQFMSQIPNLKEINAIVLREMFRDAQAYNDKETMIRVLEEMEKSADFEKGLFLQFKLRCRASICWKYDNNFKKAQEILLEAIKITIPNFNEKLADDYLLGHCDIEVIKLMADIYFNNGKQKKAVKLLGRLVESVKRYYINSYNQARAQCFIQCQLITNLGKMGKHKKVLKICDDAIDRAEKHRIFELLPSLNFSKACALFYLGKNEEAKELITQVHSSYLILGRKNKALDVEGFASKEMNFEFLQYSHYKWSWDNQNTSPILLETN